MTKQEVVQTMAVLRAAYPSYYSKAGSDDILCAINLMTTLFADVSYDLCSMASLKMIARDSAFPPAIGELLATCHRIRDSIIMCSVTGDCGEKLPVVRKYIVNKAKMHSQSMLESMEKRSLN